MNPYYPAGVRGNEAVFVGAPDEPDHPRRCEDCKRFLKHLDWEYEVDNSYPDELVIYWFTTCSCGAVNTHKVVR